ncbi:leucine-rich alpha-2-glycoprotein-like [Arapaima gigas]
MSWQLLSSTTAPPAGPKEMRPPMVVCQPAGRQKFHSSRNMDSWILLTLLLSSYFCHAIFACPHLCTCFFSTNTTQVVCSEPSLTHFPSVGLPANTTLLSVEFTNLSSISAHDLEATPLLQELHLSDNLLSSLPENLLKGLTHLHTLDLTRNQLEHLPPRVFHHAPLQNLVLRENLLHTAVAEWLPPNSNITTLNLAGNRLGTIPTALLQNLPRLNVLDLRQNHLEKITADSLNALSDLEMLHLEENKLSYIDPLAFQHTTKLTHLFLQDNQLHKVPPGLFQGLHRLEVLTLNNNKLRSLPYGLLEKIRSRGASNNQRVDLSMNPWECKAEVAYLWKWMRANRESVFFPLDVQCWGPEPLKGRPVLSLTEEEIKTK